MENGCFGGKFNDLFYFKERKSEGTTFFLYRYKLQIKQSKLYGYS